MRLKNIGSGHNFRQKIVMAIIKALSLSEVADVTRIFMHRPAFFGKPFSRLGQGVLRGESDWSVGERELFGAFVSKLNRCAY